MLPCVSGWSASELLEIILYQAPILSPIHWDDRYELWHLFLCGLWETELRSLTLRPLNHLLNPSSVLPEATSSESLVSVSETLIAMTLTLGCYTSACWESSLFNAGSHKLSGSKIFQISLNAHILLVIFIWRTETNSHVL